MHGQRRQAARATRLVNVCFNSFLLLLRDGDGVGPGGAIVVERVRQRDLGRSLALVDTATGGQVSFVKPTAEVGEVSQRPDYVDSPCAWKVYGSFGACAAWALRSCHSALSAQGRRAYYLVGPCLPWGQSADVRSSASTAMSVSTKAIRWCIQ